MNEHRYTKEIQGISEPILCVGTLYIPTYVYYVEMTCDLSKLKLSSQLFVVCTLTNL